MTRYLSAGYRGLQMGSQLC